MDRELDITGNIRKIETLKSKLLGDVAGLYQVLAEPTADVLNDRIADLLSDAVLTSYLLARRLGLSYQAIDARLGNKIRAGMLESREEGWEPADLAELSRQLSRKK